MIRGNTETLWINDNNEFTLTYFPYGKLIKLTKLSGDSFITPIYLHTENTPTYKFPIKTKKMQVEVRYLYQQPEIESDDKIFDL